MRVNWFKKKVCVLILFKNASRKFIMYVLKKNEYFSIKYKGLFVVVVLELLHFRHHTSNMAGVFLCVLFIQSSEFLVFWLKRK